ncbi:hypothetical protein [Acidithiobacillus ferridurans]|uniref:Uncharacterized protein n=1 Tax=Acidithiobacillus ferridurans TaxID=1232575 RepID=A0A8X8G8N1_ACIFI|nr:hypothetical protein [Acidithiobacillus ferridurans]MBU2717267.1 hypothetical protein [Acidithiobacillus ferridurans]MBU2721726.1 hypothetical protein [Acidithiobacillus ferridurans]MBU2726246.1 hypothetical protein [Acidithiobacillus ferridurans]
MGKEARINAEKRHRTAEAVERWCKDVANIPFYSVDECFAEIRRVANNPELHHSPSPEILSAICKRTVPLVAFLLSANGINILDNARSVHLEVIAIGVCDGISAALWPDFPTTYSRDELRFVILGGLLGRPMVDLHEIDRRNRYIGTMVKVYQSAYNLFEAMH